MEPLYSPTDGFHSRTSLADLSSYGQLAVVPGPPVSDAGVCLGWGGGGGVTDLRGYEITVTLAERIV